MSILKTSQVSLSTAYTSVTLPADVGTFTSYVMTSNGKADFYISETGSDSDASLWDGATPFGQSFETGQKYGSGAVELCQVRSSVASDTLSLIFV